ncbi:murein L,D-transpeptidase [Salinisphaera sp. Q1T1-3]|uniref:L,D-transpeptidase family protein n=1 Tax=Salinisphaera sp. Q1T1-3 TaxID=2321229 RepID=UPI000E7712DA|nr:L,D-transpeptidase family protein [Salinisphaera sp. Q1T1-3]RJS92491.1 hypothetical protein D3260_11205 [Salinisphaera sp. Q1T1-3]
MRERGDQTGRGWRRASRAAIVCMTLASTTAFGATDTGQGSNTATDTDTNTVQPQSPTARAIADQLDSMADGNDRLAAIKAFYKARQDRPAWFDTEGDPNEQAGAFIDYLHQLSQQGIADSAYFDSPLANGVPNVSSDDPRRLAAADVALSRTFVALGHDLHHGVIDDDSIRVTWRTPNPPADYQQALARGTDGNPAQVLNALAPQQTQYANLTKALAQYRQIADNGGWSTIGDGKVLKQGMSDPRIATLWSRLQATGDAPADTSAPSTYNDTIMKAMRHYQTRNGLKVDGLLGPKTRSALNVSVGQRIDEIKLNMERWRWMPASFGERYIAVNVPAFKLKAVDKDGKTLHMNVIVGGSYNDKETPIFGDTMRYLVFRPYWNVPPGIAADEIVPKQRKNPNYLASKNYQIVRNFGPDAQPLAVTPAHINAVANGDLLIRQAGGKNNALGLVKFIFPNDHSVYLHSTSAKSLFKRSDRDLSHGCVRVADPVALASYVLDGKPGWDRSRIEQAMHSGGRKKVDLAQSVPVYMMYWTAFVGQDGTVNFRKDLYGHDETLTNALDNTSQVTL